MRGSGGSSDRKEKTLGGEVIRPGEVAWSGDNSGIYLKHPADGDYVTRASYFRVTYSPHGIGKVLVLLSGPTRLCLHDNEMLAHWLVEGFARHFPQFRSFPEMDRLAYERLDSHLSEGDARSGTRERFRAPGCEVDLLWAPAGDAFFIALPAERSATGGHEMYSLFFDVWEASVFLDGRRLPGTVTARDLHGRNAPTSFLALSETWVAKADSRRADAKRDAGGGSDGRPDRTAGSDWPEA